MKDESTANEAKNKRYDRLLQINKEQSWTINLLKEKNASLFLRNAEFTRLKIVEQLGVTRSTLLADASLFSNAFHAGDPLLQQQESTILDPTSFQNLKKKSLPAGTFSRVDMVSFTDGDAVVVKCLNDSFGCQALAVTSHEHRLLKFVGAHPNIVSTIGLVHLNQQFVHVMNYESGTSLMKMIENRTHFFLLSELEDVINGIASGMNFLFDNGVVHNHVVPDNILLKGRSPVIIGFTYACRVDSGKCNIGKAIQKFQDQEHLAPELFKGSRVSYASDIFSFGILLTRILKIKRAFLLDDIKKSRLECFSDLCRLKYPGNRVPHKFLSSRVKLMLSV